MISILQTPGSRQVRSSITRRALFENTPARRINPPNCSNPEGLREKIYTSPSTGEMFRLVWNLGGWEIYDHIREPAGTFAEIFI